MIEGTCSVCEGSAQQPIGGGSWTHRSGEPPCQGAQFSTSKPSSKAWPPVLETKGPRDLSTK